jgi:hypothetical protein
MRVERWLLICALIATALAPFGAPAFKPVAAVAFPGWPAQLEGRNLTALPLTERERRFEMAFPGRIGRFTDGHREIVIRWVTQATRRLHPASDCFRGSGYRVKTQPIKTVDGKRWGRFLATREAEEWDVLEAIEDEHGQRWTDASAWYWAASRAPRSQWWAITVAAPTPASQMTERTGTSASFLPGDD